MSSTLLYVTTVLIWGSTWLAITFQLGTVDPMVSIVWRFALAALLLHLWCQWHGLSMRFALHDHLFMALQGATLFGFNYWLFYLCSQTLVSGMVAVIFSTVIVMNIMNGVIWLGSPVQGRVLVGAGVGLVGILLVFLPEIRNFQHDSQGLIGLGLGLVATWLASIGNIVAARHKKVGLPLVQSNAWGMSYGTLIMALCAAANGHSFAIEWSAPYLLSLLYLSVFGSIIAFGCYLTLIGRIGADRAAYASLLFPLVALALSTLFEDYHWRSETLIGMALVIAGNALVLGRSSRSLAWRWQRRSAL